MTKKRLSKPKYNIGDTFNIQYTLIKIDDVPRTDTTYLLEAEVLIDEDREFSIWLDAEQIDLLERAKRSFRDDECYWVKIGISSNWDPSVYDKHSDSFLVFEERYKPEDLYEIGERIKRPEKK